MIEYMQGYRRSHLIHVCVAECVTQCDGCTMEISVGEKYLGGIESCCGSCVRSLCFECVKHANELVSSELQS